MSIELILFLGLLIIGGIVVSLVIWFIFWLKARRIKKNAPAFEGKPQDWKEINFDRQALERRMINRNGNTEGYNRVIKEAVSGTGSEESDEQEIARLRDKIARAERELESARE